MNATTGQAIRETLQSANESDSNGEPANVVDGLFALARSISGAARDLGTGNAGTSMGAIEFLAVEIREASERISSALSAIATAIEESAEHK